MKHHKIIAFQRLWFWHFIPSCTTVKQAKNAFLVFFGCFWAFVGQAHNLIGWARPIPFASINSTNPRTNPWNFHEKILRIGRAGKWGFYESAILNFLFASFQQPIHMRYHLFLHYGWFFQNFGKEAVGTFMQTTVSNNFSFDMPGT